MEIRFLWVGKTKDADYKNIIETYRNRLKHYGNISIKEVKDSSKKNLRKLEITQQEYEIINKELEVSDYVVVLDEHGKHQSSRQLSEWLQHKMNISIHRIVFIIAGPYGAHPRLKDRADYTLSVSHMTLTHDMARIVIMEQVYRAFTILRGEKYHND